MEKSIRGVQWVKSDFDLYSGVKCLGTTPDILTYSVIFSHVARHGFQFSDWQNE